MPRRSSLLQLPEDLRRELNARLVSNGFGDYDGLVAWLDEQLDARGLEISVSRSALHRHGQQFESKLEKIRIATEQARAIAEGSGDDAGDMNDALIRLVQTKTFDILMAMDEVDDDGEAKTDVNLNKVGIMVARLARASVNQKKWQREVNAQLAKEKQQAAENVQKITQGSGLTKDVADQIRAEILGINVDG